MRSLAKAFAWAVESEGNATFFSRRGAAIAAGRLARALDLARRELEIPYAHLIDPPEEVAVHELKGHAFSDDALQRMGGRMGLLFTPDTGDVFGIYDPVGFRTNESLKTIAKGPGSDVSWMDEEAVRHIEKFAREGLNYSRFCDDTIYQRGRKIMKQIPRLKAMSNPTENDLQEVDPDLTVLQLTQALLVGTCVAVVNSQE